MLKRNTIYYYLIVVIIDFKVNKFTNYVNNNIFNQFITKFEDLIALKSMITTFVCFTLTLICVSKVNCPLNQNYFNVL